MQLVLKKKYQYIKLSILAHIMINFKYVNLINLGYFDSVDPN